MQGSRSLMNFERLEIFRATKFLSNTFILSTISYFSSLSARPNSSRSCLIWHCHIKAVCITQPETRIETCDIMLHVQVHQET